MIEQNACILTTKDLSILETMLDRCLGRDDPMAPLLRRKIDAAQVVMRDDIAPGVATLNSRVTFRVNARPSDTRIISHDPMRGLVGLFLPVTAPRGLALLGLSEGGVFTLPASDGGTETVRLERVLYQPEAARREKEAMARLATPAARRSALRLVHDAGCDRPVLARAGVHDCDDPGPSAA